MLFTVLSIPLEQTSDTKPVIPAISPLSDVQFSRFAETEVAKLLTFGRPRGMLEVMLPMTDDERRDLEAHLKEHFRLSLAMQIKAVRQLYLHGKAHRLQKRFFVKRDRLFDDPFFWYFFGYMDLATMAYRSPVFVVPSQVVHEESVHEVRGNLVYFDFVASMEATARDKFHRYACHPSEVAGRIVRFLRTHEARGKAAMYVPDRRIIIPPGTILISPAA